MTRILLEDFESYDRSMLEEWMEISDDQEFEIIIRRPGLVSIGFEPMIVSMQLIVAALAGHLLSETAASFAYSIPNRFSEDPVLLKVSNFDSGELAEVLYKIIQSWHPDVPDFENYVAFEKEAYKLFEEFMDGLVCPIVGLHGLAVIIIEDQRSHPEA